MRAAPRNRRWTGQRYWQARWRRRRNRSTREVAVNSILLVVEKLEDGAQLRKKQQFQIPPVQVQELQSTARFLQACEANHQRSEAGTIYVLDTLKVDDDLPLAGGHHLGDPVPKFARGPTDS